MFQKILVATDGSERAGVAVEYAAELAQKSGAELIGVTAIDLSQLPTAGEISLPVDPSTLELEALRLLEGVVKAAKERGVKVSVQVEFGRPAEAIVQKAEKERVDLIVLSSTGKGINRFLLGSVSEAVARSARCPVLLVPHFED
jgi:nucleotide-binding universal stress UspA family protein